MLRALLILLLAIVSFPLLILYVLLRLTFGRGPRKARVQAWPRSVSLPRRGLVRDAMAKHRARRV